MDHEGYRRRQEEVARQIEAEKLTWGQKVDLRQGGEVQLLGFTLSMTADQLERSISPRACRRPAPR